MTGHQFCLVERPWIPVVNECGRARRVSLRQLFAEAHALRAIVHESPLVAASVLRLALAILHRVHGPATEAEWAALWRRGRLDDDAIADYLGTWQHRFDLFDAERPFAQYPESAWPCDKASTVALLDFAAASGNNATLFDHAVDDSPRPLAAADAALHLLAYQAYAAGGRIQGEASSFRSGPLRAGYLVTLQGATLHQTLLLNLVVYRPGSDEPLPTGLEDLPVWEGSLPAPSVARLPRGWLDVLSWLSRRVRLVPEGPPEEPFVRVAYFAGAAEPCEQMPREPGFSYRVDKKEGLRPVGPRESRAAWRDTEALLEWRADKGQRARCLEQLARRKLIGTLEPDLPVGVLLYGAVTDKSKVISWAQARLPLCNRLLADDAALEELEHALDLSEDVARAFRSALRSGAAILLTHRANSGGRKPATEDVTAVYEAISPEHTYWSRLEGAFSNLVGHLDSDSDSALQQWADAVRRAGRAALDAGTRRFGDDAAGLKAAVIATRNYGFALAKLRDAIKEALTV